jgi:glycerol-3-phosphate dehydrogenase
MPSRAAQLARLEEEIFDVAVIGGGINGAAIARDAALHGLRTALIDRGDFAGQTSSHSSKLIHGGLRYLPQGQLGLVREALRERERLLHLTAPHLVHPIGFIFPVYSEGAVSRLTLWAGLGLYDLLARTPRATRHRRLGARALLGLESDLEPRALRGGALFFDGCGDDSRITLENAIDAAAHGAAVANYVAFEEFGPRHAGIRTAALRDTLGGRSLELKTRVFVNAAGPWADRIRMMDEPGAPPAVRFSKGVHIVLPAAAGNRGHSLVLPDGNGRIVFFMRYPQSILVGTTDTEFAQSPEDVGASLADVDYLLGVVAHYLPGLAPRRADVIGSFAGLRVLAGHPGAPSAISREEVMVKGRSGLITVAGGKLTTHRAIAHRVVRMVCAALGRSCGRCPSRSTPLPGARPMTGLDNPPPFAMEDGLRRTLQSRYGTRTALLAALAAERPGEAGTLVAGCEVLGVEVSHAVRNEMALTLEDFIIRRQSMAWRYPRHALAAAEAAAPLMARELGWEACVTQRQVASVKRLLESSQPENFRKVQPASSQEAGGEVEFGDG